MSFRSADLAIQPKTKGRLRMALKLYPDTQLASREDGEVSSEGMIAALGDRIINDVIKEQYPLVLEFEKEISRIEREMIAKGKK